MAAQPPQPPTPSDLDLWNYQLGGKDNFRVDREASQAASAMMRDIGAPTGEDAAQEGRHLLQRMVDAMLGQGIRQFLDLGSGFPNMANTHQIAHRSDPAARVVYVDLDPVVSTHAAALMAGPNVVTLNADLRDPQQVLGNPQVGGLLDFDQPIGILFVCMLHCLWDQEDPWAVVRAFRDAVVAGSQLAISHLTDETRPQAAQQLFQLTQELHWSTPLLCRSRADILRLFDGFTLVEPGLVFPAQWRAELHNPLRVPGNHDPEGELVLQQPEDARASDMHLCGVGIKD